MDRLVTIKSNRYGLEIYLDSEVSFETLLDEMELKLKDSAKFFEGVKMAVSFHNRLLSQQEEQKILDLISGTAGIDIVCIVDKENEMMYKSMVEQALLNVRENDGQFYRGTLRKRQILESDTSILILGDVEYGAKIIAKGSVVVIGTLSGSVYAGADGNMDAYVAALSMQPKQIRIGNVSSRRYQTDCRQPFQTGPQIAVCNADSILLTAL